MGRYKVLDEVQSERFFRSFGLYPSNEEGKNGCTLMNPKKGKTRVVGV